MEIKGTFLFLLFGLSFNGLTQSIARDSDTATSHKPVSKTFRLPQPGVYAISVVDKDIISHDTVQPNIVKTMLDNSSYLKDVTDTAQLKFGFEREQIISGKVKRAFKKVKNPQIIVLNPATGERQEYSLDHHQSFNLIGYDIQEGGRLTLQATKENGEDNLVELQIKEPYFPTLSMNTFLKDKDTLLLPPVNKELLLESQKSKLAKESQDKSYKEIDLQEVVVTGKKFKPLNAFNFQPNRGLTYQDDLLANANTMDLVLSHLGLQVMVFDGQKCPGRYRPVNEGWVCPIKFVIPRIYIDDCVIDTVDMDDLWNLDPKDIKQIEYFTEDQYEVKVALKANEAGALCIYTKPGNHKHNSLSMQSIHPLGYRPTKKPYNALKDRNYVATNDHRVTLLWNPALIVDSTCRARITFMPSSTSKNYTINIEGIGNNGEVLSSMGSHSGIDDIPLLSDNEERDITDYLERTAREKAYIQTDRNQYCTSDTVWLRVHIADALSNIPSTSPNYPNVRSKFVYVELHSSLPLNGTGESLIERIMIKQDSLGVFASYVVLPPELPSGNYTLVTYTRHELNFPEEELFHKQIQVLKADITAMKKD